MSALFCNFEVSQGQVYRLLSCTLLHSSLFHLAFNIYWLWVFGSRIETSFGHFWTLGIYLLLALTSSAAQYALSTGGVGLSGIGYGLFAFLWTLSRWDRRFANAMDPQVSRLFVVWFVFCIVATKMELMNVGNIDHAAGAIMGLLLGFCVTLQQSWKSAGIALAIGYVGACLVAAFVLRPLINLDVNIGKELADLGFRAKEADHFELAAEHYQKAIEADPNQADYYYMLGEVLGELNRNEEAIAAFSEGAKLSGLSNAAQLPGNEQDVGRTGVELAALGTHSLSAGRFEEAARYYERAIALEPKEASHRYDLGITYSRMNQFQKALPYFEQAVQLAPDDKGYHAALDWCQRAVRKKAEFEEKRAKDRAKVKEEKENGTKDKDVKDAEKGKAK
jgi:membrane associated rhomboid family serine protease